MTCKTQNFTRNYKTPTTCRANAESANIGKSAAAAGPEPTRLQVPILDLTQRVSTNQKAPLPEKVTSHYYPLTVHSVSHVFSLSTSNSECLFCLLLNARKKGNDKVNLQRCLSFMCRLLTVTCDAGRFGSDGWKRLNHEFYSAQC